jgi:DNA-binding SARP family transcriptional activator
MLEFRVLGPVEAHGPAGAVRLGGPRQQAVLAALLLGGNRVVSLDAIVDAIWGEAPPRTARRQVQNQVSALRLALAGTQPTTPIATRAAGYLLRLDTEQLDALAFEREADQARRLWADGRVGDAAADARTALRRWRGPALAGVAGPGAADQAARLEELRLDLLTLRIEADLALGRHQQLVGELTVLTRSHPLRECLRAQLMTALYRSGRKTDALTSYDTARALLVEQYGLDPGPDLTALRQAILTDAPTLATPGTAGTAGPGRHGTSTRTSGTSIGGTGTSTGGTSTSTGGTSTSTGGTSTSGTSTSTGGTSTSTGGTGGTGGSGSGAGAAGAVGGGPALVDGSMETGSSRLAGVTGTGPPVGRRPAQLAAGAPVLVGRERELAALGGALAEGGACVVAGRAGAGTSSLALRACRDAAARYPDGQLHLHLRGAAGVPVDPGDALGDALGALGVTGADLPDHPDARAGLYRTLLADRRALVLLDDAVDADQVRPLLPGTDSSAVVIAGGPQLIALEGAHLTTVGPLDTADAVTLLTLLTTTTGPTPPEPAAHTRLDPAGPGRAGLDPAGFDRAGEGRAGEGRAGLDPAGLDLVGLEAARVVVEACEGWAGLVRAAGTWLVRFGAAGAGLGVEQLAGLLADERQRLGVLALADPRVRQRLRCRYDGLGAVPREAFPTLGETTAVDAARAARLWGMDRFTALEVLAELADAELVEVVGAPVGVPRYRVGPLSRCLARELAATEPDTTRAHGRSLPLVDVLAQ